MPSHDQTIAKLIDDIKGIVAVLDPVGAAWAEKCRAEREEAERDADLERQSRDRCQHWGEGL